MFLTQYRSQNSVRILVKANCGRKSFTEFLEGHKQNYSMESKVSKHIPVVCIQHEGHNKITGQTKVF